ncbi:type II toxin-antitoxin system RelE/ParE family toxin [Lacticaseibacillus daqingensis]|uniref:type II toxin-antitoxin system RelE/ParE family toxin n=1 Tax=Lacticaseibacillus daqingensis TaxID=2486014 RepID=UPI000F7975A1|nr:type II toxin-antitoxin system mRNA interferase toxin, RelE/StbE family [Lacticaseibacillus daqingensis]
MRAIELTATYKKQYKRLKRAGWNMTLLDQTINALVTENVAELTRLWDHELKGNKRGIRSHVGQRASDWVVEYTLEEDGTLVLLLQTGSHHRVLRL